MARFSELIPDHPPPQIKTIHQLNVHFSRSEQTAMTTRLKGQCHEISTSCFFHESGSPKALSILLGPFRFFSKMRGDIHSSRCTTGMDLKIGRNLAYGLLFCVISISGQSVRCCPQHGTVSSSTLRGISNRYCHCTYNFYWH
jgi:hypothetical protein